jgi:CYTH domain-containing protein
MVGDSSKYAHTERERKFLLQHPGNIVNGLPYKQITDYYIKNTSLRFRRVTDAERVIWKLTKKSQSIGGKAQITTIYLTEAEYSLLNIFDAVLVEKIRYIKVYDNFVIGIDKYSKGNDELWLAEVEFNTDEEMSSFTLPFEYLEEVTDNINYNGFALAEKFGKSFN